MEMKEDNTIDGCMSFAELMAAIGNPDVPQKFPFNEYKIIGNEKEIYKIIYTSSIINIDYCDVERTLSKVTTNYISTGSAKGDDCVLIALKDAIANLPIGTNDIAKLLFHIWMPKNMESAMKEFASMADFLHELPKKIEVCWGCAYSDLLRNEAKVSLIAASK